MGKRISQNDAGNFQRFEDPPPEEQNDLAG